ncbi:MAG: PLP-dependent transferase [Deltaproteobacteria bacterium]|nr:PLP-dependent transferase [Deltaproteobacteria bacterium]MBI3295240.1 PLP-dependent transferase [Deltaproteobacteria bacterium]
MDGRQHFETIAVHAGVHPDPSNGAIMTPIFATSTYVQKSPGHHQGYDYSRTNNPTRTALEESLAALEGGKHALATSSGCTATDIIMHLLDSGDEVISCDDVYGGTSRLFRTIWSRLGVKTHFIDMCSISPAAVTNAKTRVIWIETPTNPLLKVIDIGKICSWAQTQSPRPLVVVDNTFASPYFQKPLALGADIVLHSTTKYLNGHSDVVGGALVVNDDELRKRLHHVQNSMGGIAGPFDSWLVLRGIKTLALRMQRHEQNATAIARFLEKHPKVERVLYPGLSSHPQYAVAKQQMSGFGGMVTFFMKGDMGNARKFLESIKVFSLAESLGGVESLVDHPAIMTHASIPPETRAKLGISDSLVRLSVGIENAEDLMGDLDQALRAS